MKLLLDVNLSPAWLPFLRAHGHEAVTWLDLGPGNAKDDQLMDWAREHRAVLMTCDLDFGEMLAFSRATHPSIIQFRAKNVHPDALGNLVLRALREYQRRLEGLFGEGAIITVHAARLRAKILPLEGAD